jgi:hypothetical protein
MAGGQRSQASNALPAGLTLAPPSLHSSRPLTPARTNAPQPLTSLHSCAMAGLDACSSSVDTHSASRWRRSMACAPGRLWMVATWAHTL